MAGKDMFEQMLQVEIVLKTNKTLCQTARYKLGLLHYDFDNDVGGAS